MSIHNHIIGALDETQINFTIDVFDYFSSNL